MLLVHLQSQLKFYNSTKVSQLIIDSTGRILRIIINNLQGCKMKTLKTIIVLSIIFMISTATNISSGTNQNGQYLAFAEVMPEPIGGIGAIIKTISYPEMAKRNRIEGKVYVLAHINENGVAEDVKIVRGIGAGCDEVAIKAVKKAKYNPGQNKGQNVKVKLTMAITFKLS